MVHPIGVLKRSVAEAFNVPIRGLRLQVTNTGRELESDDDERCLKDYGQLIGLTAQRVRYDDQQHPRIIISEQPAQVDLLFDVLSKESLLPECQQYVWELILKLPVNRRIK